MIQNYILVVILLESKSISIYRCLNSDFFVVSWTMRYTIDIKVDFMDIRNIYEYELLLNKNSTHTEFLYSRFDSLHNRTWCRFSVCMNYDIL